MFATLRNACYRQTMATGEERGYVAKNTEEGAGESDSILPREIFRGETLGRRTKSDIFQTFKLAARSSPICLEIHS